MPELIHCEEHGPSAGRMVCQHLCSGSGLGYARVEVPPGEDDYETAMCEACEQLLLAENAWSDKLSAFAGWKLYCCQCYDALLLRHTLVAEGQMRGT
jgi:hypothetical protein